MKTEITNDDECPAFLWDKGDQVQIDLPVVAQYKPAQIHVLPAGSLDGQPSFVFLLESNQPGLFVCAQITLNKLWPSIEAAIKAKGYQA